jgi:hypothetical protein
VGVGGGSRSARVGGDGAKSGRAQHKSHSAACRQEYVTAHLGRACYVILTMRWAHRVLVAPVPAGRSAPAQRGPTAECRPTRIGPHARACTCQCFTAHDSAR